MRKIRNPRYAPEFLERKLSPTGLSFAPTVQVGALALIEDPPIYPPDDPSVPMDPTTPAAPPSTPSGPTEPC
jgi:hypothetical protein